MIPLPLAAPEILPMNANDLDEIAAAEAVACAFPWSAMHYADSLEAGYGAWVCRLGGELVGHMVVMQVLDEAHLLNVVVSRKYQGQGYGARLLQFALHHARQQGAMTLLLEVRPSNDKAIALYKNFGFQQIGLRRGYYPADNGREDGLVMEKALT